MITAFALWLDSTNNQHWEDIYAGTVLIDLIGIITTGVLLGKIVG